MSDLIPADLTPLRIRATAAIISPPTANPDPNAVPQPDRHAVMFADIEKLHTSKPSTSRIERWAKIGLVVFSAIFGYEQYLEHVTERRIEQAEKALSDATAQLSSPEPEIRAAAVRTIYTLAFQQLPIEPEASWNGPVVNLSRWVSGRREHRLLDRSRNLFRDFARSPRLETTERVNMVSTAIVRTAIDWIQRERTMGKNPVDPSLWFLREAKLTKAYAPSSNLQGMQLDDADLSFARLNSSNLDAAYMQGSNLEATNFESCSMQGANLIKTKLAAAKFSFAHLAAARLDGSAAPNTEFTLADLTDAHLDNAVLTGATFRTAQLVNTDFANADLRNTDFSQADLRGANFEGAQLDGADFRFANNLDAVRSWKGAQMGKALLPSTLNLPTRGTP